MQVEVDRGAAGETLEPAVTHARYLLVGRILGLFVALFLVVFGYIKLEESLMRGYYTTLLRLGAGTVVLSGGVGPFLWP